MTTSRKLEEMADEYASREALDIYIGYDERGRREGFEAGARAVIEMLRSPEATEELFVPRLGQHENHAMAKWLEQQLGAPHE